MSASGSGTPVANGPGPAAASATPSGTGQASKPNTNTQTQFALCWQAAILFYNDNLTKNKKKKIDLSGATGLTANYAAFPKDKTSCEDLQKIARHGKNEALDQKSEARKKVEGALTVISEYSMVVDVLIQHHPDITALVWGSFRFLLMIFVSELELAAALGDALADVVRVISQCKQHLTTFEGSKNVFNTITELFGHVLKLLIKTTLYFLKPTAIRILVAGFTRKTVTFENLRVNIDALSLVLDREIVVSSETKHAESRKAQSDAAKEAKAEYALQTSFREANKNVPVEISEQTVLIKQLPKEKDVQSWIKRLADDATKGRDVDELNVRFEHILRWLRYSVSTKPFAQEWSAGTCRWIFDSTEYKRWESERNDTPLWVFGIPGCGKTVLAHYMVHAQNQLVLGHFYQKTLQDSLTAYNLTAAVLGQIISRSSRQADHNFRLMITRMWRLFSHYDTSSECPLDSLWDCLNDILDLLPRYTLVVDGIDECHTEEEAVPMLKRLVTLASKPNSRVVILSRQHHLFKEPLQSATHVHMDLATMMPEILRFVQLEVDKHPSLHEFQDRILAKTQSSAQGMFLWARLMLDYLKRAPTRNERLRRLIQFPPGLTPVYQQLQRETGEQLDPTDLLLRHELFLTLAASVRPLKLVEVSEIIALQLGKPQVDDYDRLDDTENTLHSLCWPFISFSEDRVKLMHESVREYLYEPMPADLDHPENKFLIHFTRGASDAYLAAKCLTELNLEKYTSRSKIVELVRGHIYPDAPGDHQVSGLIIDDVFYEYACLNWHKHLTAVDEPEDALMQQLEDFIQGPQFITWAETMFLLKEKLDSGSVVDGRAALKRWLDTLPPASRDQVHLEAFFQAPYKSVSAEYPKTDLNRYLILSPLADYYNWGSQSDDDYKLSYEYHTVVAEGYERILGMRVPLTLRGWTNVGIDNILQGLYHLAEDLHARVGRIQREVLGLDNPDTWTSREHEGLAMHYQTKFNEAVAALSEASGNLDRTAGPSAKYSLFCKLYLGYALDQSRDYQTAHTLFEVAWKVWDSIMGPDHPATQMTRAFLGISCQKLGRLQDALGHLIPVFDSRVQTIGLRMPHAFDTGLALVYLYRHMDLPDQALARLDLITQPDCLDFQSFERLCQTSHVRALLHADESEFDDAEETLAKILEEAGSRPEPDRDNRETFWIRLLLANVQRRLGRPEQDVLQLFEGITRSSAPGSGIAQDTTSQLDITEKALRLTKKADLESAIELLQRHNLTWNRPESFWIATGGPVYDTAWASVERFHANQA